MPKVLLLTFDAESRAGRQRDFEQAGFTVAVEEPKWPAAYDKAQKEKPDVIAVDCAQLPSHCRETAEALRTGAQTRNLPVVLFRVAEHDVERTRLKVTGGVVAYEYELIDRLRSAVLTRIANQAAEESAAERAAAEKKAARRAARPAAAKKAAKPKAAAKKAAKKPAAKKPAKKPAAKKPAAKKPAKKPAAKKPAKPKARKK